MASAKSSSKKGALMVATGRKSVREANISAKSLKEKNKNIPIVLRTDQNIRSDIFDKIEKVQSTRSTREHRILRIKSLMLSPFDQTLYLDTDTYVSDNISEVFDFLNEFDIAGKFMNPPYAHNNESNFSTKVPKSFPWINAGVLAYKKCNNTNKLFKEWLRIYKSYSTKEYAFDQIFLREALYRSSVRICPLPENYNCTIRLSGSMWGGLKILHAAGMNHEKTLQLPELAKSIQKCWKKSDGMGVIFSGSKVGNSGKIIYLKNSFFRKHYSVKYPIRGKLYSFMQKLNKKLKNNGVVKTLNYVYKRFKRYVFS